MERSHYIIKKDKTTLWATMILFSFFFICTCCTAAHFPKASPDAKYLIVLNSDKERTSFYVDGKLIAEGKTIKVYVNKTPHKITAQAQGYIGKHDLIRPPYREGYTVDFFFLIEDKLENQVE